MTETAVEIDLARKVFGSQRQENERAFAALAGLEDAFSSAVEALAARVERGGRLIFCGNGGSASSAAHMVNDCVGHMYLDRDPLPAISLSDNASVLTALANDYGYEHIFERQIRAIASPEDVLVAISTSGNSGNVLRATRAAKELGVAVVALTGRGGGELRSLAEHWLFADTDDLVCAEHVHLFLLHTLTEALEAVTFPDAPGWGKTISVRDR